MTRTALRRTPASKIALAFACVLAILCLTQASFAWGGVRRDSATSPTTGAQGYTTTLEQCVTSTVQSERSATFTAQMVATEATQRMGIKIELQQRMYGETEFHTLMAPGFGQWRGSESGVKIYKYVRQVTNLTAPAAYRALIRFRWLDDKGHVLKRTELHTPRCQQPLLAGQLTATPMPGA